MPRDVRVSGLDFHTSPHHSSRHGLDPQWVVMHYDAASDGRRLAEWIRRPETKRSAHFHIFRDGVVCQTVELDRAAWHAGISEHLYSGEMTSNANRFTIGIEFANLGRVFRDEGSAFWYHCGGKAYRYEGPRPLHATLHFDNGRVVESYWEPYTQDQILAAIRLLDRLRGMGYDLGVTGHDSIAMPFGERKWDPGPLFPWTEFDGYVGRVTPQLTAAASLSPEDWVAGTLVGPSPQT